MRFTRTTAGGLTDASICVPKRMQTNNPKAVANFSQSSASKASDQRMDRLETSILRLVDVIGDHRSGAPALQDDPVEQSGDVELSLQGLGRSAARFRTGASNLQLASAASIEPPGKRLRASPPPIAGRDAVGGQAALSKVAQGLQVVVSGGASAALPSDVRSCDTNRSLGDENEGNHPQANGSGRHSI